MLDVKDAVAKIGQYVDARRDEMVQFLVDFIAVKSETYQEGEAVQWLAGKMREFGFDEVRVDAVGNLLGRVGSGKTVLLYDAHIDTVELGDPAEWGFDPLVAKIENGVIHGRGAVDDKGPLTGIVFAARALKDLGLAGDFTLWISASISEEDVEGSCVEAMMKENPDVKPDYVLVAECSENQLMRGHKGRALIRITVPGKCAHGSTAWQGDNAVIKALPIIDGLDKLQFENEDPDLGRGTIEVTRVETFAPSLNTIPGKCVITCDRRIANSESIDELIEQIKPLYKDIPGVTAEIDTETVTTYTGYGITCVDYFPSWVYPKDHPYIQAGAATYKAVFGREPEIGVWPFCTNATSLCGRTGIPSLGFGPGVEEHCHSTDDSIDIEELLQATKYYAALPLFAGR